MGPFNNIFKMLQATPSTSFKERNSTKRPRLKLLNFHMDTRWCFDQEAIMEVAPLALPVESLDADDNCEKYKVNNLPTIMLVDSNGQELHRWTGITSSQAINDFLVDGDYVSSYDVPPVRGEIKEVKDYQLRDGSTYTGASLCYNGVIVPEGMGIRKYSDHNELGHFSAFCLNGVCYRNYHQYMYAGLAKDSDLEGWGMQIVKGEFLFGQYHEDKLVVNVTPLVLPFWHRVNELTANYDKGIVKVQKDPDCVFVGCPQMTLNGRFGITFRPEGDVFIGQSDLGVGRELTGYYLHFSKGGDITKGYFQNGYLNRELEDLSDDQEDSFVVGVQIWSTHEYNDFDISQNCSPDSYDIRRNYLYGIVELGNTPNDIIVKANPYRYSDSSSGQERIEVSLCEDNTTRWFAFARNDSIMTKLKELYDNDTAWAPIMRDFRVDFVNNIQGSGSDHLTVYRHRSCWEKDNRYRIHRENVDVNAMEYYIEPEDEDSDEDDFPF